MLETLSTETLEAIFDTLPVDITFVDDADTVRYFSRGDKRIFKRSPEVLGKKVQDCHSQESLDKVNQVINDLKEGRRGVAESWRNRDGRKIYTRYFAVKDKDGRYVGTLEVNQDITDIQKIEGQKRLVGEG